MVIMGSLSVLSLLVYLLLFSGLSSCQDSQESSMKWARPYFLSLVRTALEEAMQEAPDIMNCTIDLITLMENNQSVKLIGKRTVDVPGIGLLLDAAGKPPAGLLQVLARPNQTLGPETSSDQTFQVFYSLHGNMEECKLITIPLNHSSEMYYGYLSFTLKSINTNQPNPPLPIKIELCLPSSCNSSFFKQIIDAWNPLLANLGVYVDPSEAHYVGHSMKGQPLTAGANVMIVVCSFILLLVLVGTVVDKMSPVINDWEKKRRQLQSQRLRNACSGDQDSDVPLLGHNRQPNCCKQFLFELVTAFSLYKNIPMILATHQPAAAITSLNGVRVISMFWVIMFHVYTFAAFFTGPGIFRNFLYVGLDVLPRFGFQVVINGLLAVYSFFFLSGVLTSYLTLREMERRDGRFPLVSYYSHRFLRLTPTYMFVLFFNWFLTMYLAQGTPSYQTTIGPGGPQRNSESCRKYWWTNLLYINNFYPEKLMEECMNWSWYLANDMQFFVISPLIIIPMFIWFPGGVIASGILLLTSFVATGFISGFYRLPASPILPLLWGLSENPDNYLSQIYLKPYCSIGSFIIGLLLGAIFYYNYKPSFSKFFNWLVYLAMWVVATAIGMAVVYGLYGGFNGHELSLIEKVLYNTFGQTGWGVALALLLYACHHGYGGPINSFLSMPFWVPLSRLTFSAYLVHPIILTVIFGSQRDTLYYTDITMVVYIVGSVVLSYGAAGVVSVVVEFPITNVEMAVFKVLGAQLRESTRRVQIEDRDGNREADNCVNN